MTWYLVLTLLANSQPLDCGMTLSCRYETFRLFIGADAEEKCLALKNAISTNAKSANIQNVYCLGEIRK